MRLIILLFIITILFVSINIAIAKDGLGVDNNQYRVGTLAPEFNELSKEARGQRIEGTIGKLLGNEKINLNVDRRDGSQETFGIITKNREISEFNYGKIEDATLNMYADEEVMGKIISSKEPFNELKKAMDKKEVTYKATSIGKKVKFVFIFTFARLFGLMRENEEIKEVRNCGEVTLYVDSDTPALREGRDGSFEKPFKTIREAFEHGERNNCNFIKLEVDKGEYSENGDFYVTRSTRIRGYNRVTRSNEVDKEDIKISGMSLTNRDPENELILSHITIIGEKGIDTYWGFTTLVDVNIIDTVGQGVRQMGGRIDITDSIISGTKKENPQIFLRIGESFIIVNITDDDDGAGMFIGGGTEAALTRVRISENENGGLRISDKRTKVYATDLTIEQNEADRQAIEQEHAAMPGRGALEVRNGALLLIEESTIDNNEYIGLFILDGGDVNIKNSEVKNGRGIEPPIIEDRRDYSGGSNIIIKQNTQNTAFGLAELEFTNLVSRGSDSVGLYVTDGKIMGHSGEIINNVIGVVLSGEYNDADFMDCFEEVRLYDNENDMSRSGGMPIPSVEELIVGGLTGEEEYEREVRAPCADVPFECTWCP